MFVIFCVWYLIISQGSQLIQMKVSAPAETGDESPVTSFVQLERYNAIRLVQIVHASLASLSKVIRGTALLDAEVQALAGALLKQEVSDGSKVVAQDTVEFAASLDSPEKEIWNLQVLYLEITFDRRNFKILFT